MTKRDSEKSSGRLVIKENTVRKAGINNEPPTTPRPPPPTGRGAAGSTSKGGSGSSNKGGA